MVLRITKNKFFGTGKGTFHVNFKHIIFMVMILLMSTLAFSHDYTPLHIYEFEDGLTDTGKGSADLTNAQGTLTYANGKIGKAGNFEESVGNQVVTSSFTNFSKTSTIEYWYKAESCIGYQNILEIYDGNANYKLFYGHLDGDWDWWMRNGNKYMTPAFDIGCNTSEWIHVIVIYGVGGARVHINGDTTPVTIDTDVLLPYDLHNLYLGTRSSGADGFDGLIDNFAFFEEQYTTADVTYSYNTGDGIDFTPPPRPEITSVLYISEYNIFHNFTAIINSIGTDVDTVIMQIESPTSIYTNYTMSSINDTHYDFNEYETTEIGEYSYSMYVNASDGLSNEIDYNGSFNASIPSFLIDILFSGRDSGIFNTTFDEGENFYVWANYTANSTLGVISHLSNQSGYCEFTVKEGINEQESVYTDFNICDNDVCEYTTLTESFDMQSVTSVNEDTIRIIGCHDSDVKSHIDVDIVCGASSDSFRIDKTNFPTCVNGFATYTTNLSGVCTGEQIINVTLSGTDKKPLNISEWEIDREFEVANAIYPQLVIYNETLGMFRTLNAPEFYEHGSKEINASCYLYLEDSSYNVTESTSVTIVNEAPRIFFNGLENPNGTFYDASLSYIVSEFQNGNFIFYGSVVDNDLTYFNVTFTNSTGGVIFSATNQTTNNEMTLSSTYFEDLLNPYTITVTAIDSYNATTQEAFSFNFTDTVSPACTGFDDATLLYNETYTFNANCTDEQFDSLLVIGSNGYVGNFTNLFTTGFILDNSTDVATTDVLFQINYCDASYNCVEINQTLTVNQHPITGETPIKEFSSTQQALFWIFLTLLWLGGVLAVFTLKGKHGNTIQIANIFQGFLGLFVGISWLQNFSFFVGLLILLTAVVIFVGKMLEAR